MSSLKNSAPRREHRERSQPLARRKFGLLEKHKDYVLRAKDYHRKQDTIKAFKEKARFRNPDEFYFKMVNSKTQKGVHIAERENNLDNETLKLLRTQDLAYITHQRTLEANKIEKLKNQLHFIGSTPIGLKNEKGKVKKSKHTIFVDDNEKVKNFKATEHFNTVKELLHQKHNRLTVDDLKNKNIPTLNLTEDEKKEYSTEQKILYSELEQRIDRERKLAKVEREMITQKALMGKGTKKKVGLDSDRNKVYKFTGPRKK